ncbi:MAG TPA: DUF262 domain-containing protein [Bacteroidales bacterium]|nr:DUF262 domain-containing protein [Bacteroidales bacterium]
MKLKELAEIKIGLNIPQQLLRREKNINGVFFQCVQAKDFDEGIGYYIIQKNIKTISEFSRKSFLYYGDYIFYKKQNEYKLLRYEGKSGQTIFANGFYIITAELSIIKEFFSFDKNRNFFCNELLRIESSYSKLSASLIGEIEIWTDNIKELEEADIASQIGIRNPVNIKETPIRITQKSLPFDKLLKRIKHGELLLDTEFQRRPGLWDQPIKSRLIESLIIKLPIPAFYFDGSDDDKWLVIDGLQRLSAVNDYVNGEYELIELDYLPELQGKKFSDLDRIHQRNIEEFEIFACIIEKETPIAVKYKVFKNINTSALILKPQEIRHALNPGKPAIILKSIAEKQWFSKSLILSDKNKLRMEDRELALRFLTFQISNYSEYKPTIVDFLDKSMYKLYDIPNARLQLFSDELENIFNFLFSIYGENCFSRSLFDDSKRIVHNNIIFELLTYGVSKLKKEQRDAIMKSPETFKQEIANYFGKKEDSFWEYDVAYTQEKLRKRFEEIEMLFKKLKP